MITIIDYNSGNIGSVTNALERLGEKYLISSDPIEIIKAEKIIFPGVGRAKPAMTELKKRGLVEVIKNTKAPFLGICLGMQLLLSYSQEDSVECLDIIPGQVKRFPKDGLKVPQIGWNSVDQFKKDDILFKDILDGSYFYFVNSYYVDTNDKYVLGQTDYCVRFASVIKKDNFYGVQFHPEKSGDVGERMLSNFVKL